MKQRFIAFCLCLLFFQGYSQDYVVDLQSHPLTIPGRNFYVSQVIDARLEKANIGTVQTGAMNSRKVAVFKQALPEELMSLFKKNFFPAAGMNPVIVKVLKFQIREKTKSFSESAFAEVLLQFIYEKTPGQYLNLYEAMSLMESKGADVTARHDDNLVAALADCFTQFAEQNFEELVNSTEEMPAAQLEEGLPATTQTLDFAILKDSVYQQGVYLHFREFRNNKPGITQPLVIDRRPRTAKTWQGTDEVLPYLLEPDRKRKNIKNAWGFSDGKEVYIRFGGEYYPMKKAGNVFSFYGHVPTNYGGVYAGGLVGGAIGGAVVGVASAAAASNSKTEYVLDMIIGRVSEMGSYAYQPDHSAKIVIYYRGDKSKLPQPANLMVKSRADSLTIELKPNSFAELEWNDLLSDVSACVQGVSDTCFAFLPDVNKINYFEYVPVGKRAASATIRSVTDKEAEFYLKQIRYSHELEEKRNRRK